MRARSILFATLVSLVTAPSSAQSPPTVILVNGRIFTADSLHPWAEALAIRGERITAVGTSADIARLASRSTRRIDLGGRVVIPGINDAHDHLADKPLGVNFLTSDAPTPDPGISQVLDSLRAIAARTPPGTWIATRIGLRIINDSTARRAAIDRVSRGHPVTLFTWWGHPAVLNSAALTALRISDSSADPLGGWFERDSKGRLTGRVDEYGKMLVARRSASRRSIGDIVAELRDYSRDALRHGVTTVQDMTTSFDPATTVRAFRTANLPLRVRLIRVPIPDAAGRNEREWDTVPSRVPPRVVISGRKWILDGTPGEENALRRTPYPDRPGWYGRSNFPLDTVRVMLAEALRPGAAQLHLHIAGDSMTAIVLNLMESLAPDSAWRATRLRFEHGDALVGEQLQRALRKGIVIAQPRAETAPFRAWRDVGIPVAFGSDGLRNPFFHMMIATAKPGADTTQRIGREDWVRIMTRNSAWAERAEKDKGVLAPGMLADLAVLSQDIFRVPAEALPGTVSVLTMVGGKIVLDER